MNFPRRQSWLNPSTHLRLTLTLSCFLLTSILFLVCLLSMHIRGIALIFDLPIAIASWMFKRRGAYLSIAGTACVVITTNCTIAQHVPWPTPPLPFLTIGLASFATTALFINFLDKIRTIVTTLQHKIQLANRHIATVYAYQQSIQHVEKRFLNHIAHELRTPLMGIHCSLSLLQEYQGQLDLKTQATFLDHATHGCQDLEILVDKILSTLQIGDTTHDLYKEELLLANVILESRESFTSEWQQRLQVALPDHLMVMANKHHLLQIFHNLLSNACKYSPPEAPVLISATLRHTGAVGNPPQVCVSIQDAGPGIAASEFALIFQKFARLEHEQMGPIRGIGLGLYISKHLVEDMGGEIWVESSGKVGEGSRFCFTLPAALNV